MPVYILGALTAFLIMSFIFYPKANLGQTLQIAILGILINAVNFTGSYYAGQYFKLSAITLNPEFILYLNPVIIGTSLLFSILALCAFVKIMEVQVISVEKQGIVEIQKEEPTENTEISENTVVVEEEKPVNIGEVYSSTESVESVQESSSHEIEATPCTYAELFPESHKQEEKPQEEDFSEYLAGDDLEEREIRSDEDECVLLIEEKPASTKNIEFIPTNIRLSDTQTTRKTESKGQVASIGKLLVNDKKIENVIESNESLEEGILDSRTNVITTISGEKIYEKFSEMKDKFDCIREIALIDKGGFTLANDFEDKQRAQIAGALIAGVYHTLQNYVAQLSLDFPVRIFFETAGANSFIVKTADEVLFSTWEKEFKHVDYGALEEIFAIEDFSLVDMTPYTDLMKIENMAVADIEGNLVNSLEAENSEQFAAVTSAIFENLKVFLMNIQLVKLSKIVIFTPKNVLTIAKDNDKIVSILTDSEDCPKISEDLLKMEEIY